MPFLPYRLPQINLCFPFRLPPEPLREAATIILLLTILIRFIISIALTVLVVLMLPTVSTLLGCRLDLAAGDVLPGHRAVVFVVGRQGSDLPWLRTNGVNTNGVAAKVTFFVRLGKKGTQH